MGEISEGSPKLRYKDVCKATLRDFHIDVGNWERLAEDRVEWRRAVGSGMEKYSKERDEEDQRRREQRHRVVMAGDEDGGPEFICTICNRICRSRIGLFSHERACRRRVALR